MIGIRSKLKYVFAGVFACLLLTTGGACNVNATADAAAEQKAWNSSDGLFEKGLIAAARRCYTNGSLKNEVTTQEIIKDGFWALFTETGLNTMVPIPSGYGLLSGKILTNQIACGDLFLDVDNASNSWQAKQPWEENVITSILRIGAPHIDGVDDIAGNKNVEMINRVMDTLGYVREIEEKEYSITFQWDYKQGNNDAVQIIRTITIDPNTLVLTIGGTEGADGKGDCSMCAWNPVFPVWFNEEKTDNGWKVQIRNMKNGNVDTVALVFPASGTSWGIDTSWATFKTELKNKVYSLGDNGIGDFFGDNAEGDYEYDFIDSSSNVASNYKYKMKNGDVFAAVNVFQQKISGIPNFNASSANGLRYSTNQKVAYFLGTLKNHFYNSYTGAIIECGDFGGYGEGNRVPINIDANGIRKENCYALKSDSYINDSDNHTLTVYGFDSNSWFSGKIDGGYNFQGVIDEINKLTESFAVDTDMTTDTSSPMNPNPNEEEQGDPCWGSNYLNGMNWVLCPTVNNLQEAATGISFAVDDMMKTDTVWYNTDSKTYEIWGYMRGIANVLVTIVLLVIVFSQLTGYGIDNYGIKKMLPKLIIMAILINLSFIVCQLAIDASNIVGMGINNLLTSIGGNQMSFSQMLSTLGGGFMALIAGAGFVAPVVFTGIVAGTSTGFFAWIVFILALLAILVGVFIFFLMLGARVIIIIMFTILSPIAFSCYILPNTQKYFKNWWKVFSTALVIYPICGAMYGLSGIIRGIVFQGDEGHMHLLMALVAILTPVLPYYIMPTLLKNTMNALGSVGGALNSLSSSLRKGFSGAESTLRGTETYKALEKESARNRQLGFANRTYNRLSRKDEKMGGTGFGGRLSEREQRNMAKAIETKKALETENMNAGSALALHEFEGRQESEMQAAWEKAYIEGDDKRLIALTDAMHSKYGVGAIAFMGKAMARNKLVGDDGKVNGNIQRSLSALNNNVVTNKNFGKDFRVKATDAFKFATSEGRIKVGVDEEGNDIFGSVNLETFSKDNGITTTYADTLNQSAAAVERMALAGGFNAMLGGVGAAAKMLASENKDIENMLTDIKKMNAVKAQAFVDSLGLKNKNGEAYSVQDYINEHASEFRDASGKPLSVSDALEKIAKEKYKEPQNRATEISIPHGETPGPDATDYGADWGL